VLNLYTYLHMQARAEDAVLGSAVLSARPINRAFLAIASVREWL
jgi:hypothetical protein